MPLTRGQLHPGLVRDILGRLALAGSDSRAASLNQWYNGGAVIAAVALIDGDDDIEDLQAGIIIDGVQFGAVQGTGKIEIGDSPVYALANLVAQTVTAWSDTQLTMTAALGGQTPGQKWVFITNGSGERSAGYPILLHRQTPFRLIGSPNISPGAVDPTTSRLTTPVGAGFTAGTRTDDINPVPLGPIPAATVTNLEAALVATGAAVVGQTYEFRVVEIDFGPLTKTTALPQWTVTTTGWGILVHDGTNLIQFDAQVHDGAVLQAHNVEVTP